MSILIYMDFNINQKYSRELNDSHSNVKFNTSNKTLLHDVSYFIQNALSS